MFNYIEKCHYLNIRVSHVTMCGINDSSARNFGNYYYEKYRTTKGFCKGLYLNLDSSLRPHSEKSNKVGTMGSRKDNPNPIIKLQNTVIKKLNFEGW